MAQLLAFHMTGDRLRALTLLCASRKIRLIRPPETVGAETIEALFSGRPAASEEPLSFDRELWVLHGFSNTEVNALLDGWRRMKQPPVRLKAMTTPTNAAWTVNALYAELSQEDAAMHGEGQPVHQA